MYVSSLHVLDLPLADLLDAVSGITKPYGQPCACVTSVARVRH